MDTLTLIEASLIIVEVTLLLLIFRVHQLSNTPKIKAKDINTMFEPTLLKSTTLRVTKEVHNNEENDESSSSISVHVGSDGSITTKADTEVPKS